ncbi:uncharacterized protein LOC124174014 [Ischnura elegans]|uniref:uncharacterized protein LOC124174014 n=1 Tax=Ischnura elegans TaxID=197161 RepID=UPI001ED8A9A8|nr:uncharacterized protein LOC124174014 [Ischnura elegans]
MKTFAILFAVVAAASAATLMNMNDKEFEAMMERMASQVKMNPMIDMAALMNAEQQPEDEPEAVEAEELLEDDEQEATLDDDSHEQQPHLDMFNRGMTGVIFPDMMTGAIPYSARHLTNKPIANNHELPNGNGKARGGSAAVASASSSSSGPNSFSSSQAQAFSRGSK